MNPQNNKDGSGQTETKPHGGECTLACSHFTVEMRQTETDELTQQVHAMAIQYHWKVEEIQEVLELVRRYSHHQTEQAKLEARIDELKALISIIWDTDGSYYYKDDVPREVLDRIAELERLKEQSLPTNKDKEKT